MTDDTTDAVDDQPHCPHISKTCVTKEDSADETHILPFKQNEDVVKNLRRNCNQRNLDERKRNVFIDNVACLNEHLQIMKENLLRISCKINELQELNKRKEIEQSRNSTFVCCCFIVYILCLVFFIFGVTWLYSNF